MSAASGVDGAGDGGEVRGVGGVAGDSSARGDQGYDGVDGGAGGAGDHGDDGDDGVRFGRATVFGVRFRLSPDSLTWLVTRDDVVLSRHVRKRDAERVAAAHARGRRPSTLVIERMDGTCQSVRSYGHGSAQQHADGSGSPGRERAHGCRRHVANSPFVTARFGRRDGVAVAVRPRCAGGASRPSRHRTAETRAAAERRTVETR